MYPPTRINTSSSSFNTTNTTMLSVLVVFLCLGIIVHIRHQHAMFERLNQLENMLKAHHAVQVVQGWQLHTLKDEINVKKDVYAQRVHRSCTRAVMVGGAYKDVNAECSDYFHSFLTMWCAN